jgi:hypothetical protein
VQSNFIFLKVFMERVKKCVGDLEDKVEKAEEQLGNHSIKKVLNAIPYLSLMQVYIYGASIVIAHNFCTTHTSFKTFY